MKISIKLLKGQYAVCRLSKEESIPNWGIKGEFFSITKTADELSIVCEEKYVGETEKCEKGWRVFKVLGPLDFSLIGILSKISTVLAEGGVSIFAISTYDTDYILVKDDDLESALNILGNDEEFDVKK